MQIILHPKYSVSNSVRVWVGVRNAKEAPELEWNILALSNNVSNPSKVPVPIKELQSVRSNDLLFKDSERVFSGIYEFRDCKPDSVYAVNVKISGTDNGYSLRYKTLPGELPWDKWFNILLVSCYYYDNDKGNIDNIIGRIPADMKPDLSFFMGDQVYLDLPVFKDFPEDKQWLAEKFESDYAVNWFGIDTDVVSSYAATGFPRVLSLAPSVFIPDDHEFWNNYPHECFFIGNSKNEAGRNNWREASIALFEGFQSIDKDTMGGSVKINIPPVSFFLADLRTFRDPDKQHTFKDKEFKVFEDWIKGLNDNFGFLITGQSLFTDKVGKIKGEFSDFELPNYGDYPSITDLIKDAADGKIFTCITGDVHWGRVAYLKKYDVRFNEISEIVVSPASLVENPITDPFREAWGWVKSIFGHYDPWKKHSKPDEIGDSILPHFNSYSKKNFHSQVGNQVGILSLKRSGVGVDAKITYLPNHRDKEVNKAFYKQIDLHKLLKI